MRLGIMQPYFFPYLGYYSLIKHTDNWILFDTVQYIRHGWIDRNRVLKPGEGWQYISVPLQKHNRESKISEILIREENWREKLFRQLEHYKKAPYYADTINVIRQALDINTTSITRLNAHILNTTCAYLNVPINLQIFSDMNLEIEPVNDAGEWALNISKALDADCYINPPGGIHIFDKTKFDDADIELKFMVTNLTAYPQRRKSFEPGLSIIDVMMFNEPAEINKMLDDYKFEDIDGSESIESLADVEHIEDLKGLNSNCT